jgi:ferrochelatase
MPDSRFTPEPPFTHGQSPRTAILYCNLGTPDAPTPAAVRRYLSQFLSDHRVVEIPRLLWMLILHGIVLRVRPAQSAAKYASIWTPEGSPLKVWTARQATLLQGWLAGRQQDVLVRHAMTYGADDIGSRLEELKALGVTRLLVLPAYPQYSATTTAGVFDAVYRWAAGTRLIPELRFVNRYHDEPLYIEALVKRVRKHWLENGPSDQLVMSFHGVPQRTLQLGDPYHCECHKTARLLAEGLGLRKDQYKVTFQSRLGRAQWLEPYTEPTLVAMARSGVARVDVICPGFTSDCLETLEEIGMEAREAFLHAGGKEFRYISCLNDQPEWISALCAVAQRHMAGWDTAAATTPPQELAQSRARALELGAKQ